MNAKHIEGSWEISFEAPRWIIQAEHGPGKKAIAYLIGDYLACAANARLIAAAPDMFEALKMAQLWLDVDGRYDMQAINAALSKAQVQS